jgi:hypothetical protein
MPKIFARSATEWIIGFCDRRNGEDSAPDLLPFNLAKHSPRHILLMPAGIHEDALRAWFQSGTEIVLIPVPTLLPHGFAVGIFARAEQIITHTEVSAKARDAGTGTDSVIFATAFK